jgi:3-oxoadipate enol-lactonase
MVASLHYVEGGRVDGPVVVLGTSLGTTTAMWDPQVPALAERCRVVLLDHRGLGGDVLALLERLSIDRFSWVGLSLGGMVGMWLATRQPERFERLALVCTAAHLPPAEGWLDRAATVRREGTAAIADAVVGRWFTPGFIERERAVVDAHRAMLLATPPEGYASCCDAIGGMDLRPDLPAATVPTLVIAGADDPATPPSFAEEIADGIPWARLEVLPDAAHLAGVEQPALVTKLLVDHIVDRN